MPKNKKKTTNRGMMRCKSAKNVSPVKKDKTLKKKVSPMKDADMIVIVSGEANLLNEFPSKTEPNDDSPELPQRK